MTTKVDPIPVEVINHPEPKRYEVRASYRSAVLTATNPSVQIAGYDPLRMYIRLSASVNAYVISSSTSQANDAGNLANPITQPNGRYVPANLNTEVLTDGQNDVWLSTGTYPTIIGYEIVRKVPQQ